MNKLKFSVLGAGAGGQSMAAILSSQGYSVKLYDNNSSKIETLKQRGSIQLSGKITCEGRPELITDVLADALSDVDVIMIATTTDAHKALANECAPYLRDGQILLLNPGHVCGALEVSHIIRDIHHCTADIVIGECSDLMYSCRVLEVGSIFHSGLKSRTEVATLPSADIGHLMEKLQPIFPNLVAAKNILETGFEGSGAMLHPIPSFMNVNHTDRGERYDYYIEGITPSIAKLVSQCDQERLAVCRALGLNVPSLVENLQHIYGLEQDDLYDLLQHNNAYKGLNSPPNIQHRFFTEDTLCGIVPLASVGAMLGVKTPIMDSFIQIASVICGRDFLAEGRNAESLGLVGKSPEEIQALVR